MINHKITINNTNEVSFTDRDKTLRDFVLLLELSSILSTIRNKPMQILFTPTKLEVLIETVNKRLLEFKQEFENVK